MIRFRRCRHFPPAPIITSRGCPLLCAFCAARSITGTVLRYRSVKNVVAEIVWLHERYGVREFHIEDDNFTPFAATTCLISAGKCNVSACWIRLLPCPTGFVLIHSIGKF